MKAALFAVSLAFAVPAAAQTMEPGEWQFTSTMTSPMLPKPQSSSVTRCVSKADAEDPTRFSAADQLPDCQVKPGNRTAGSYSWTMSCPKQGMQGAGQAKFGGATLESEMRMTMDAQGQKMEMFTKTSGRRLGPCKTK